MSRKKPAPKKKRTPTRIEKAVTRKAGIAAAVIGPGAALQLAHIPGPPVQYATLAAGGVGVMYGQQVWDAVREHCSGGRAAARRRRKYQGTATALEIRRSLSVTAARKRAAITRPSLTGRIPAAEAGIVVARAGKQKIMASFEDFVLVLAPPRKLKTALISCWVEDAPAAVLATSTRADLHNHTVRARARKGPVHTLNPDGHGGIPTTFGWDLLDGCEHPATARERAGYLMAAAPSDKGGKDAWWDAAGADLLRLMLHAAATGGATAMEARRWVLDPFSRDPAAILASQFAAPGWAEELAAFTAADNDQARGIISAAAGALSWMSDPAMARIACPAESLNAADLITSGGTVYLIGADRPHGSLAPFFAAFAAHLFETGKRIASVSPGGRLDPPLMFALDEAAITCPVPLHKWSSEAGGHGMPVLAGVQAYSQLLSRWGPDDGKTIFSNATVKVVSGGFTDHADLEAISAVCGDRPTWDAVKNPDGSVTRQPRAERLFPLERLRQIPDWHALILHRSARPLIGEITPVWARKGYQRAEPGWTLPETHEAQPAIEAPAREPIAAAAGHQPIALPGAIPVPALPAGHPVSTDLEYPWQQSSSEPSPVMTGPSAT